MGNTCLATLVELMLDRIEVLELRVKKLETHNYNMSAESFIIPEIIQEIKGAENVTTQTDVD